MLKSVFTPGRVELAGNHTDHQNGRVLASAIDLGLRATFEANGGKMIHFKSDRTAPFEVRIDHLRPKTADFGTPKALVPAHVRVVQAVRRRDAERALGGRRQETDLAIQRG